MDSFTMTISLLVGAVAAGLVAMLFFNSDGDHWIILLTVGILMAAVVSSYLMIPKIGVDTQTVYITNRFVKIRIPVSEIKMAERFNRIGFNIRTFGVGGLFGYFGYFNGNDVWYVTNIKKKVKITLKSGKIYMISPENPEGFIKELNIPR